MFYIRRGTYEDVTKLRSILEEVYSNLDNKDWFCISDDTIERIQTCVDKKGFILIAMHNFSEIAGFLMVRYPDDDENSLRPFVNGASITEVVHMETAAILPEFRGNGLEARLLRDAERLLEQEVKYILCTVHKDNIYSLNNLKNCGYKVLTEYMRHGNLPRCVMMKERKV